MITSSRCPQRHAFVGKFRSFFTLPASCLIFLGSAFPCHGQKQYYLLEETTVQKNMSEPFEKAQKDYCAAVVRGGAPACLVLAPTTFASGGNYLTLLSFGSFGHYDGGTYTSKGLTPEQARDLSARRTPTIASNPEVGIMLHDEVSYLADKPSALTLVTDFQIRPGTLPELLSYVRRVELPAAHANGLSSFELYQVVAGGYTNRYLLLRRFHTFSQMDKVVPFGDRITGDGSGQHLASPSIEQVKTTVMRTRMDLSAIE